MWESRNLWPLAIEGRFLLCLLICTREIDIHIVTERKQWVVGAGSPFCREWTPIFSSDLSHEVCCLLGLRSQKPIVTSDYAPLLFIHVGTEDTALGASRVTTEPWGMDKEHQSPDTFSSSLLELGKSSCKSTCLFRIHMGLTLQKTLFVFYDYKTLYEDLGIVGRDRIHSIKWRKNICTNTLTILSENGTRLGSAGDGDHRLKSRQGRQWENVWKTSVMDTALVFPFQKQHDWASSSSACTQHIQNGEQIGVRCLCAAAEL